MIQRMSRENSYFFFFIDHFIFYLILFVLFCFSDVPGIESLVSKVMVWGVEG